MASPYNLDSSISSSQRVVLKREDRRAEMLISQVTTVNLRCVFQVDPATVWLQNDVVILLTFLLRRVLLVICNLPRVSMLKDLQFHIVPEYQDIHPLVLQVLHHHHRHLLNSSLSCQ